MTDSDGTAMRLRILNVAEHVLGETGYHGARLHQIAERSGIKKASLFHYFANKEALYRAVVERSRESTEDDLRRVLAMPLPPRARVAALLEAYVDKAARNPDRLRILMRHGFGDAPPSPDGAGMDALVRAVADLVRRAQGGAGDGDVDAVDLVLSVVATVAFFFTGAPVLFPGLVAHPSSPAAVSRVKRHVREMVQRALAAPRQRSRAVRLAAAGTLNRAAATPAG
ncbi:MAG TPA: TetR/AcrR family transcriptional regulator [Candidatus Binatia bacterium]|nr:TetR/AcrR family transcriptional regulator [Candidatus Binatia bacterium]